MGSPQTFSNAAEAAQVLPMPTAAVPFTTTGGTATPSTDGTTTATATTSEVARLEAELKSEIAAVRQTLASFTESVKTGLHNRVNELEGFLKRKYPYG